MDPLHLPLAGLPFLLHLPQVEQQRLHYDVYIKQNKNGKDLLVYADILADTVIQTSESFTPSSYIIARHSLD